MIGQRGVCTNIRPFFDMSKLANQNKNIVVVGHLVWDRINYSDGHSLETFGGIAYNLAALASVIEPTTTIYPICYLGKNLDLKTRQYWKKFINIDWAYARTLQQNQEIHALIYDNTGYRKEKNSYLFPKLSKSLFKGCSPIDIALVNYIGGDEFPPKQLRWLRNKYNSKIYLDFHSLALSRVSRNKRHFRYHPHWRKYTSQADFVQMNVYELKTLFPNLVDEPEAIFNSVIRVLDTGPEAVIVTRESEDLVVVWRNRNRIIKRVFGVPKVSEIVDSTGCGDSFAGGFVSCLIQGKCIDECCHKGLALASRKIAFSGLNGFFKKN
jgi:sugar/nucleoside kinase (ribokinase family)